MTDVDLAAESAAQGLGELQAITNSLGGLAASFQDQNGYGSMGTQLDQTTTLWYNNRWYLISNNRQLVSELYVEHGIVQTLVDQPVEDAFRAGFEIKSGQLSADDIERLLNTMDRYGDIRAIMQGNKWSRLYGGGAVIVITDQDPKTPLNMKALKQGANLEFRSADIWELYNSLQNVVTLEPGGEIDAEPEYYDYYGLRVHNSRVFRIVGKEPPSFLRARLRGWGMSELEKVVRSLNQYMKNQDVIFELLDEAKVDVYKIKGFNEALITTKGTTAVSKRIQNANIIKNFQKAITMDVNDDYIQKQVTFTGLAEVLTQIRQGIAADLKMPMTKLFGISAAGFNSGEDDIENYNSMIEGEVRAKIKYVVVDVIMLRCQQLFGFMPEDLTITWNPLRMLNAKEEEEVKNHQFNRTMSAYQAGTMEIKEFKEAVNKDSLLPIEIDVNLEALPPIGGDFTASDSDSAEGDTGGQ